jgi:glycosyltransferase involved in cell wall biosynthesis
VFDEVRVLVRAEEVLAPPPQWVLASGAGVLPQPLPCFNGPVGFLSSYRQLKRLVRRSVLQADAMIVRLPCAIGSLAVREWPSTRPFGVELVGDPREVYSRGAVRHPLRMLFRVGSPAILRGICGRATGVAYVSGGELPSRYPVSRGGMSTRYSSIELDTKDIVAQPRCWKGTGTFNVITVGSLDQLYKGTDTLIQAVALSRQRGRRLRLSIVGDGRYRGKLEGYARELGVEDAVEFVGQLTKREEVFARLDEADLFVLPSRTEGTPKALIEAMARGLPAIGSAVGGIPELLDGADLVPPNDAGALAQKIVDVLEDPARRSESASRNLQNARLHASSILGARRRAFFDFIANASEAWNCNTRSK